MAANHDRGAESLPDPGRDRWPRARLMAALPEAPSRYETLPPPGLFQVRLVGAGQPVGIGPQTRVDRFLSSPQRVDVGMIGGETGSYLGTLGNGTVAGDADVDLPDGLSTPTACTISGGRQPVSSSTSPAAVAAASSPGSTRPAGSSTSTSETSIGCRKSDARHAHASASADLRARLRSRRPCSAPFSSLPSRGSTVVGLLSLRLKETGTRRRLRQTEG